MVLSTHCNIADQARTRTTYHEGADVVVWGLSIRLQHLLRSSEPIVRDVGSQGGGTALAPSTSGGVACYSSPTSFIYITLSQCESVHGTQTHINDGWRVMNTTLLLLFLRRPLLVDDDRRHGGCNALLRFSLHPPKRGYTATVTHSVFTPSDFRGKHHEFDPFDLKFTTLALSSAHFQSTLIIPKKTQIRELTKF